MIPVGLYPFAVLADGEGGPRLDDGGHAHLGVRCIRVGFAVPVFIGTRTLRIVITPLLSLVEGDLGDHLDW